LGGTFGVDARVLLFTFGTAAVTGLVFGALLAVPRTGRDLRQGLAEAGLRLTGGRAIRRIQRGLVITEIGAAFTLAICAGLMVRTFTGLLAVDPGFNPQHVLAIGMGLPGARADQAHPFFEDLAQRVRLLPGVQAVAVASSLPIKGPHSGTYCVC